MINVSYEASEECYTNDYDTVSYMYWAVFRISSTFSGNVTSKIEVAKCLDKDYAERICSLLNSANIEV